MPLKRIWIPVQNYWGDWWSDEMVMLWKSPGKIYLVLTEFKYLR